MASQKEKDALPPGTGRQPFDPNTHAIPAGPAIPRPRSRLASQTSQTSGRTLSLEPPRYPFAIDRELAAKGERVFSRSCSRCRNLRTAGRYQQADFTGRDRDDPTLAHAFAPDCVAHYLEAGSRASMVRTVSPTMAWVGADIRRRRWMASGPRRPTCTMARFPQSMTSSSQEARRARFTPELSRRPRRVRHAAFGLRFQVLTRRPILQYQQSTAGRLRDVEARRGDAGHLFGDLLNEEERMALIEYLKTL